MPTSTAAPSSLWSQTWQWATSPTVRAQYHAERTFLTFLASEDPESLDDAQRLVASLAGAAPDLVNRPLPATGRFTPEGQPGVSPLMWALLTCRWGLAKNLLDLGADPTVHVPETVLMAHAEHLQKNLPYTTRLPTAPNTVRSPLAVAIQMADRTWEDDHRQQVRAAWVDDPYTHLYAHVTTLDQHPALGPLLTTLLARTDLPWSVPEALVEDPQHRADSAPIRNLVGQGSSLIGWPDDWLRRMDLDWHSPKINLLGQAVGGCFAAAQFAAHDHLPAYVRLRALGVDPQAHVTGWANHPVRWLRQAVTLGPLKPEALLDLLDDPALDAQVRDPQGRTLWDGLTTKGLLSDDKVQGVNRAMDLLNTRRVMREAQALRRAIRKVTAAGPHPSQKAELAPSTHDDRSVAARPSVPRARARL